MQQSRLLQGYEDAADDLGAGIAASFPILSIEGKVWTIKYRGEEKQVTDERGYPRPDVDVVIVMAPKHKSKVYFGEGRYIQGQKTVPVCWASDGKVPDAEVDAPQASSCAVCPHNVIGSRITDQGKKAKACSDHKRVVVVPAGDVTNESYGGPMLLRIPPTSLVPLQEYGDYLKRNNALYFGCVTTLSFDPEFTHQVIKFEYARPLSDEEVPVIIEHRASDQVQRILNEEIAAKDPNLSEAPVEDDTPESNPGPIIPETKPRVQPVQSPDVKPAVAPQAPPRPAQPVPPRPATPIARTPAAPAQAQPTPPTRPIVGAFSAKPAAPPVQPQTAARGSTIQTGTINRAVAQPAKAPVSARPVQQDLPLEEEPEGEAPDELDAAFGAIMKNA
jgi:hypothetical protein